MSNTSQSAEIYAMEYLGLPRRECKPRKTGITMARDAGLSVEEVSNIVETYGEYIDYAKIRQFVIWYTPTDTVLRKIEIFRNNDIAPIPGGTVFEAGYLRGQVGDVFRDLWSMGFTAIELSENVIHLSDDERKRYVSEARDCGFEVFFELGTKYETEFLNVDETAEDVSKLLGYGARAVILERSQLDINLGPDCACPERHRITDLAHAVGAHNIVFEAESIHHQMWLIGELGADVNLGPNIDPFHIVSKLEPARVGIGRDEGYSFYAELGADGARARSGTSNDH